MPKLKYGFASIVGQRQPIRLLSLMLSAKTIPHALLFTGIEGVGKRTTAKAFAMMCNCRAIDPSAVDVPLMGHSSPVQFPDACGVCSVCRKILSENHPDVIQISPQGSWTKIGQIRELCETLSLKPYEANTRVVILADAHTLNPEAANALLKMLEEPPERTVLILTALQISDLLPTIVSRCHHIRFKPLPRDYLASVLVEQKGIAPREASALAAMANGSLTRACALSKTDAALRRKWLISCLQELPSNTVHTCLAMAERIVRQSILIPEFLEIMKIWFRDMLIFKYDSGRISQEDYKEQLADKSSDFSAEKVIDMIEVVRQAERKIKGNAHPRLVMENVFLKIYKLMTIPQYSSQHSSE